MTTLFNLSWFCYESLPVAPPVTFSTIPEAEGQLKSIEAGNPIVLHCELSNPTAQVCWYKDGKQLHPQAGLEIQSVGSVRRLIIESASFFHSGVYSCDTADDVITFKVDVEGEFALYLFLIQYVLNNYFILLLISKTWKFPIWGWHCSRICNSEYPFSLNSASSM